MLNVVINKKHVLEKKLEEAKRAIEEAQRDIASIGSQIALLDDLIHELQAPNGISAKASQNLDLIPSESVPQEIQRPNIKLIDACVEALKRFPGTFTMTDLVTAVREIRPGAPNNRNSMAKPLHQLLHEGKVVVHHKGFGKYGRIYRVAGPAAHPI